MPSTISAGTTAGTAIAIAGDTTGNLAFQTNGTTTAMTITTSQNVGIGTTSPTAPLTVVTPSGGIALQINGRSSDNLGGLYFYANNGTTSYSEITASASEYRVASQSTAVQTFYTNGSERMRIASDGTLQVKSSTTTAPWDATSGNYVWVGGTYPFGGANSDIIAIFNRHTNNGTVVEIKKGTSLLGTISHNGTNTAYNTSSDYRLKENIAPMQNALNLVQQLKPCTYTWKANGSNGQGFIAHELQECLPDAVTGEKDAVDADGKIIPQQIDTSFLVATLTAAIQELKAELDATKAEVQALKGVA